MLFKDYYSVISRPYANDSNSISAS